MRTVRKGWIRYGPGSKPIRVLVDDHGFYFGRGLGGWKRPTVGELLKILPVVHVLDYWPFGEWWERGAWQRPEWSWIYGA